MPIVPVINSAAPSMDSILDTNKGNSFECNQIRYITNTIPECSIGVIRDAEKVFGRMIAQSPPPATLAKGQGPSVWNPKKIDIVLIPPWSVICLDGPSSKGELVDLRHECDFTTQIAWHECDFTTQIVWRLWPHLQRDSNTVLRPLPWPSFNCQILVMQSEKSLPIMFCYSVSKCKMKLH